MRLGYLSGRITMIAAMAAAFAAAAPAQTSSITTISTSPAGAQYGVDGQNYNQPTSAVWPQGSKHVLSAVPSQLSGASGTLMVFNSWNWAGEFVHATHPHYHGRPRDYLLHGEIRFAISIERPLLSVRQLERGDSGNGVCERRGASVRFAVVLRGRFDRGGTGDPK